MFPFSIGLTQDASTVDAVFNRVLPSARLQSAPTEGCLMQDASTVDAVFNRVLPPARLQSAPTEGCLMQDASTVDAVFNRVLPPARLQSAPTEGGFWHLRLSCPIAMPFQIICEKYNIFHEICQPLLMKRENVSATFQGFRDFILRASTRAGSRRKLHITANIILKILKILKILLLSCKISPNVVNYNYKPKGDCVV